MNDPEITVWADRFWRRVGREEEFPRSLESAVLRALPLAIVKLPSLAVGPVNVYLRERKLALTLNHPPRQLRACLVAHCGRGLIFLDGGDPPDQQRYSLAHEVAHYLLDHYAPRQRAIEAMGRQIIDVLNGQRPPTIEERWSAVLQSVTLQCQTHLFDRDGHGAVMSLDALDAEDRADRLALELLAPEKSVTGALAAQGMNWSDLHASETTETVLIDQFGLPASAAGQYARWLNTTHSPPPSYRDWLKKT